MKVLKITDAIKVKTAATECIWEWDSHKLELIHYLPFSHMNAGIQTSVDLDGKSIWSSTGQISVHEVWPHIAVALLAHDILCEPLTPEVQTYPVDEIVSPE